MKGSLQCMGCSKLVLLSFITWSMISKIVMRDPRAASDHASLGSESLQSILDAISSTRRIT